MVFKISVSEEYQLLQIWHILPPKKTMEVEKSIQKSVEGMKIEFVVFHNCHTSLSSPRVYSLFLSHSLSFLFLFTGLVVIFLFGLLHLHLLLFIYLLALTLT